MLKTASNSNIFLLHILYIYTVQFLFSFIRNYEEYQIYTDDIYIYNKFNKTIYIVVNLILIDNVCSKSMYNLNGYICALYACEI